MAVKKKIAAAAAVLALTAGSTLFGVNSAQAVDTDYCASGVNIRTGPSTGYTSVGMGYPGQRISATGYATGQSITATTNCWGKRTSTTWRLHKNLTTGKVGYSWWYYLN